MNTSNRSTYELKVEKKNLQVLIEIACIGNTDYKTIEPQVVFQQTNNQIKMLNLFPLFAS